MKIMIAIAAVLCLGLGTASGAEKAGDRPKRGVLDGVLRRGSLAAAKAHPRCTGLGLERTPGAGRQARAVKNGVELLLTSADPAVAAKLQAEAPGYYAQKKGTDCGCCPAAVPGAKTKVKNISDGVRVTITAPTSEGAARVRALAGLRPEAAEEKKPAVPVQ